jgi:hypothetical protein
MYIKDVFLSFFLSFFLKDLFLNPSFLLSYDRKPPAPTPPPGFSKTLCMTIIPNLLSLDPLPIYLDLVDIMGYYLIQENKTFLATFESKTCPFLWETYMGIA